MYIYNHRLNRLYIYYIIYIYIYITCLFSKKVRSTVFACTRKLRFLRYLLFNFIQNIRKEFHGV